MRSVFCVWLDVLVSAISLAILEKNTDNTDRQRVAQPEQVCVLFLNGVV